MPIKCLMKAASTPYGAPLLHIHEDLHGRDVAAPFGGIGKLPSPIASSRSDKSVQQVGKPVQVGFEPKSPEIVPFIGETVFFAKAVPGREYMKMAEREGFEAFFRFKAGSRAFADLVKFQFLKAGNRMHCDAARGRQRHRLRQPPDNLGEADGIKAVQPAALLARYIYELKETHRTGLDVPHLGIAGGHVHKQDVAPPGVPGHLAGDLERSGLGPGFRRDEPPVVPFLHLAALCDGYPVLHVGRPVSVDELGQQVDRDIAPGPGPNKQRLNLPDPWVAHHIKGDVRRVYP